MSDTWDQLQAHKRKHESLRERLAKRRKERQATLDEVKPVITDDQIEKSDSASSSSATTGIADIRPIKEELKSDVKVEEDIKIKGLYLGV